MHGVVRLLYGVVRFSYLFCFLGNASQPSLQSSLSSTLLCGATDPAYLTTETLTFASHPELPL